jgi:uncharacterized protein (UPF0261 family)
LDPKTLTRLGAPLSNSVVKNRIKFGYWPVEKNRSADLHNHDHHDPKTNPPRLNSPTMPPTTPKTIAICATLDTKGDEVAFARETIEALGDKALLIDLSVIGEPAITPDLSAGDIARGGGSTLEALRTAGSRADAAPVMVAGAAAAVLERIADGRVHAVLGLGGTQGTSLCAQIMQQLPYGFPKIILSTAASGDTSPFVDIKDITMSFAVCDILGLNPFLRSMLANAAGAASGMAGAARSIEPDAASKGTIAMTNLGVLTDGAKHAIDLFHQAGYEVITFHAIGAGGRAMEQMMREGLITGVFDYALGEIADELFDALRAADQHRLTAAGSLGLPQVICPGGAEHIGLLLHTPNQVPEAWAGRKHVFHSPIVFAPRLDCEQITRVGCEITKRLEHTRGKAVFMIPTGGVSRYSIAGGPLEDRASDDAFFETLRTTMPPAIDLQEMALAAEDPAFVETAVNTLITLIEA